MSGVPPDAPAAVPEPAVRFRAAVAALQPALRIVVAQVDPDALGSAFALAFAVRALRPEVDVRIYAAGAVGHPQNRAIVNRFDLASRMRPIAELPTDGAQALVDSSVVQDSRLPAGVRLDPAIVIDHHRAGDVLRGPDRFVWIDETGAASTLLVELLDGLGLEAPPDVAVLLALGIHADTHALVSADARDRAAWDRVVRLVDRRELQALIDYPLPESHFRSVSRALDTRVQRGSRVVAGLGFVDPAQGDDLSTLADWLLRQEGVDLVVVWGIVGDTVRISARNDNLAVPLDEFLRTRFGPAAGAKLTPDGKGEGGARLRLDLGLWASEGTRPQVEAMVDARIRELVLGET